MLSRVAGLAACAALCAASGALAQPANNVCGQNTASFQLPGAGGSVTQAVTGATRDAGSGACTGSGEDVYYYFTPNAAGPWQLSTCTNTSFDSVLSIHTGCPAAATNYAGTAANSCNDDFCGSGSQFTTGALTPGTQYVIRISAYFSATPNFTYTLTAVNTTAPVACCSRDGTCTISTSGPSGCPAGATTNSSGVCDPNPCPQPPGNDDCLAAWNAASGSWVFGGTGFTASGDTRQANITAGQEALTCTRANGTTFSTFFGYDVFYAFTPSVSNNYNFSLCGSAASWDSVMSIHDPTLAGGAAPCPPAASNTIACNDDGTCTGGVGLSAIANVPLTAGVKYLIRIGAYSFSATNTAAGNAFTLDVSSLPLGTCCSADGVSCALVTQAACGSGSTFTAGNTCGTNPCPAPAPVNDLCSGALNITALPYTSPAINLYGATGDIDVQCNSTSALETNNGVWFTYTPSSTVNLALNNTTGPDTVTAIFTGDCNALTEVACSDPAAFTFPGAAAGTTYYILVGIWSGTPTATNPNVLVFTLDSIVLGACCNNNTGACTTVTAANCPTTTSTFQGNETVCSPSPCAPTGACCSASGACTVTTAVGCAGGSSFQGLGTTCDTTACPQPVACCFAQGVCVLAQASACASAGGTADTSGATSCAPTPCPGAADNYSCATAIVLPANTWRLGNNSLSSDVLSDPLPTCQASSRRDAWFTFTASASDNHTVTTCGSTQDTIIQVFTVGDCADTLTWTTVGCDDDGCAGTEPSLIPLTAAGFGTASLTGDLAFTAGVTYHIRLSSWGTGATGGNYQIRVNAPQAVANVVCCRGATCAVIAAADCTLSGPASGTQAVARPALTSCAGVANTFSGCCYADYDKSGSRTIDDIFIYLNGWFANSPYTRVGGDGTGSRTIDDIFLFLNAWFGGCNP